MRTLSLPSTVRRVRTAVAVAATASLAVVGLQAGAAQAAGNTGRVSSGAAQSSPTGSPLAGSVFQNTQDYYLEDLGPAISSPIQVTGVSGNAPADLKITVDIDHEARGDLRIDVIAPDGTVYRIKDVVLFEGIPHGVHTYTLDASAESANGTWQLKVQDRWGCGGFPCTWPYDGNLRSWKLSF